MRSSNTGDKYPENVSIAVFVFIAVIIPLVVHLKMIAVDREALNCWNSTVNGDLFSYCKSLCICGAAVVLGGLMLIRKVSLKRLPYVIPLSIMVLGTILSTVFSSHPHTSIHGFPDRYEGVYVLMAYNIFLLGASTLIKDPKQIRTIITGLFISAAVIGIIGVLQYFGLDYIKTDLGRFLVDPSGYGEMIKIADRLSEGLGNAVYSTLYNPNVFGMYMAMLFPLAFFMSLLARSRKGKILFSLLTCLLFAGLLMSFSRGSLIGAVISVAVTAGIMRERLAMHRKHATVLVILFVAIGLIINAASTGAFGGRIGSFASADQIHVEDRQIDKVKDFKIDGRELSLYCTKSVLNIMNVDSQLWFYDGDNLRLEPKALGGGVYGIADDRYKHFRITYNKNLLTVRKGRSFLYFAVVPQSFFFLNARGGVAEIKPVKKVGFEGWERIGSGRGYIWSRSLPLLSRSMIIGTGPDTYALEFPQGDYKGKLKYLYDAYIVVDKPHNMYLQTALNTGLLSLLSMLAIFIIYIVRSIKALKQNGHADISVGLPIFAAVVAYLAAGLFTDSTVSTAPVFWLLLGLGFCIGQLPCGYQKDSSQAHS